MEENPNQSDIFDLLPIELYNSIAELAGPHHFRELSYKHYKKSQRIYYQVYQKFPITRSELSGLWDRDNTIYLFYEQYGRRKPHNTVVAEYRSIIIVRTFGNRASVSTVCLEVLDSGFVHIEYGHTDDKYRMKNSDNERIMSLGSLLDIYSCREGMISIDENYAYSQVLNTFRKRLLSFENINTCYSRLGILIYVLGAIRSLDLDRECASLLEILGLKNNIRYDDRIEINISDIIESLNVNWHYVNRIIKAIEKYLASDNHYLFN